MSAAPRSGTMKKSTVLNMASLRMPQIGLSAFENELLAVKLDLLLWGWNWRRPAEVGLSGVPPAEGERDHTCRLEESRSHTPQEKLGEAGVRAGVSEPAVVYEGESLRTSARTEILKSEDTPSDGESSEREEVQSVQGTPTGVLCRQMVPLLRYLDRKVAKTWDLEQGGSYVELVRNWTRAKEAANPALNAKDRQYKDLDERYKFLHDQLIESRRMQKAALKMRDSAVQCTRIKLSALRTQVQASLDSERIQNRILKEELVPARKALEEKDVARRMDEDLLRRLQSQCDELRSQ
ncbi:hypothetical protein AXG93_2528s2150 [Marchantia polymorpha subsp. ruderalis]|uniref:Uncharacterized protein n=1 Tax=Marchantia polymorpha subsp. ruderalis TaxID=1480154 RepID=A0A176WRD2_MARPO|nr:hypothetical protein AXG93_2528s2150 [Marchantia polymorpha subsp. ruderalis]